MGMDKKKGKAWSVIQVILSSPQFWSGVGTVLTAIWAWAQGWFASYWAPLTIPIILIVVALTFYLVKQFKVNEKEKQLTELSDKELESTIHGWVDIPRISVTRQTNDETLFQFDVVAPNSIPITIKRRKVDPFFFHFGVIVTWKPETKEKLRSQQEPMRSNLMSNLRIEMLRLGIQFEMKGNFDEILLVQTIPLDDTLTRFYFLQQIYFVIRCASLVGELIEQSLKKRT